MLMYALLWDFFSVQRNIGIPDVKLDWPQMARLWHAAMFALIVVKVALVSIS